MKPLRHLAVLCVLSVVLSGCGTPHGQPRKGSEMSAPNDVLDFPTLYAENCAGSLSELRQGEQGILDRLELPDDTEGWTMDE